MERKVKLLSPKMPNFILLDMYPNNVISDRPSIPITDLSEQEAEEFGEMMKQEFIKHYNKQKHVKK